MGETAKEATAENLKGHIAILGAGPTGIEAALAAHEHGYGFSLYEASPQIAGHVQSWSHVRLFTPWAMNISARMSRALERQGLDLPEPDDYPTGGDLVRRLFDPLSRLPEIAPSLALGTKVISVGREGLLKHEEIGSELRSHRPFRLLLESADGKERLESADVVLDCSGNAVPNTLGGSGLPALGERHLENRIGREVPGSEELRRLADQRILLVGAGHSAQTALRELAGLAKEHPDTQIHWVLRGQAPAPLEDDPLEERFRLMSHAADLAAAQPDYLTIHERCTVDGLAEQGEAPNEHPVSVTLRRLDGTTENVEADHILALTGRVGDHLLYRQLQVHECYATSGPMKLAAALLGASGAGGDCLAQTSLGPETLRSPEPGFFILGSKSYGRRNDYLMQVGWQQVDEIFQLLD